MIAWLSCTRVEADHTGATLELCGDAAVVLEVGDALEVDLEASGAQHTLLQVSWYIADRY
ncbi:MAG: hypothetical protein R3C68_05575 [Myxococcota bacterium]